MQNDLEHQEQAALKSAKGKITNLQTEWINRLNKEGYCTCELFRFARIGASEMKPIIERC